MSEKQLDRLLSILSEQDEIKKMNRDRMQMRALINDPKYKEEEGSTGTTGTTTGATTGTTEIEESMDSFDFDTGR